MNDNHAIALLMLVFASASNSAGQLLMRAGGRFILPKHPMDILCLQWLRTVWRWALGLTLGWLSGICWAICLCMIPVATGLPVYIGVTYMLTTLGGVYLLGERLTPRQWVGGLLVVLGITLIVSMPKATP